MTDEDKPSKRSEPVSSGGDVISNLPRHRPYRRSEKRTQSGAASGAAHTGEREDAGRPSTATARAAAKAERAGSKAANDGKTARPKGERRQRKPASAGAGRASAKAGEKAAASSAPRARERIGRTASAKTRAPTPAAELKAGRAREARRSTEPSEELPGGPSSGTELVGTVVQAAGELAQIGLTLGRQAVKNAVKRLPKP